MAVQDLYDLDFFEWTQRNAELLNRKCFEAADISHIAEELADLGKRDQREVRSYLRRLIVHLLKWQMQPAKRSSSWLSSIGDSRSQLEDIFQQSPSLRKLAAKSFVEVYSDARRQASTQTRMAVSSFPSKCPYRFEQILDADFLPKDKD
jgi:hypothetical protein